MKILYKIFNDFILFVKHSRTQSRQTSKIISCIDRDDAQNTYYNKLRVEICKRFKRPFLAEPFFIQEKKRRSRDYLGLTKRKLYE